MSDFMSPVASGVYDIDKKYAGPSYIGYSKEDFPPNFPYDRWQVQQTRYYNYWNYFTGRVWEEAVPNKKDSEGNPIYKFPLRINYIKPAAMKSNYVLWGEVPDDTGPLTSMVAYPRLDDENKLDESKKKVAKQAENFVNGVWTENFGRSLQQDAGLVQQFLGGIIFKVGWQPDDPDLKSGIRLEYILPDFFLPVWDSGRFNNLLEAWVVYRMPAREAALRYGWNKEKSNSVEPIYIEHWTKDTISITLDKKPIKHDVLVNGRKVTIDYSEAKNPFGFVPFVYIPRERAGTFYGLSIVDDLQGLSQELNARLADFGDIIRDTSQRDTYVRNITGTVNSIKLAGRRPAVNLGVTPSGTTMEPDAFVIDPPNLADSLSKYPQMLYDELVRDSFMSGVAYGEDEGSQRSALTLAFRMWPITSKVRAIRNNWTDGLTVIANMILKIAFLKGVGKITEEHLDLQWRPNWNPMVPRDREAELNEILSSVDRKILSPETALGLLRIVYDASEEYEKVKEHMSWEQELMTRGQTGNNGGSTQPVRRINLGQNGQSMKAIE